jgi:hypothetical protein
VSVIRLGFGENDAGHPSIVLPAFLQHFDQRFRERQQLKRRCMSMHRYTGLKIAVQNGAVARVWIEKSNERKIDNIFLYCYYNSGN